MSHDHISVGQRVLDIEARAVDNLKDSLDASFSAACDLMLNAKGRVIVTGCLGAEPEYITGTHPKVLAVTGPHQYEQVLDAVHSAVPPSPDPFVDLLPPRA